MMKFLNLKIPPPLLLLISGCTVWFLRQYSALPIPFGIRAVLGGAFIGAGLSLDLMGLLHLQKQKTTLNPLNPNKTVEIVKEGIYSKTRNPMYMGMVLVLLGFCLITKSSFGFLVIPVFIKYLETFQIEPEETILREKFGADYDEYCKKVRRWF